MMAKIRKKIERLAGTHPHWECPHCGYKNLERVSQYCNMCGRPVGNKKEPRRQEHGS